MQKKSFIYEIKKMDTFENRKKSIGVFFKSEKLAKEFIQKFVPEKERELYSFVEREEMPVYESMSDFVKENPLYEAARLGVERDEVAESSVRLPFALNVRKEKGKTRENKTVLNLSLTELRFIIRSIKESLDKMSEEEVKAVMASDKRTIAFEVDNYFANQSVKGAVSYGEYKLLDQLYDQEFDKLKDYSHRIHLIEKDNREDNGAELE